MCKTDRYPSGERRTRHCRAYSRGEPCQETVYHHTTSPAIDIPRTTTYYHRDHLPPSPRLTPGSSPMVGSYSSYGSYHPSPRPSHHESDSDSSGRRRRRHRRPAVLINGEPITPDSSRSRESSHRRGERIVIVENPPTARTPPQQHAIPRTAPSSPSPLHDRINRHRPVIVDESGKRRVRIEVPSSPQASESSSSGSERWRVRREESERRKGREAQREEAEEEARRKHREVRIEQANRRIADRPERPLRRASTAYVRPTVEVPPAGVGLGVGTEEVTKGMRALSVEEDEDEAQQQRLRERFLPRRRASVGPGARRARVQYEDGMYRLE